MEKYINILSDILKNDSNKSELINRFQEEIWDIGDETEPGSILDILRDLALDLEYCIADNNLDKATEEIRLSLKKIKKLGKS